jgi:cytochrome c peroxidase
VNNGTSVRGLLFDIGVSDPARRTPDMPVYTVRHRVTGALRGTTDPGKAFVTGRWTDLNRFKTPTLRGAAARPPYFHNGIAPTLRAVVDHYESALGFSFTKEEADALVAFLEAL